MHFGKNNKQHNYYMTDPITKTQTTLSKSTAERDLGIIITTNLKSTIQANKAASKANSILGLMKRTFVSRNVPLWKKIYKTYIRPHLEFAVSAWNPCLLKDIKVLEQVQRRATKVPSNTKKLPYEQRNEIFNLTSLQERRTRGDLIQQYKLSHKLEEINWQIQPIARPARGGHREHYVKEIVRNCKERSNFFNNRIVTPWNTLPDTVVNAENTISFKIKLDDYLKHSPKPTK